MNELFDLAPSLSPRLLWMREHGITVNHFRATAFFPEKFVATCPRCPVQTEAHTEENAVEMIAQAMGWPLWNEPSHPPKD